MTPMRMRLDSERRGLQVKLPIVGSKSSDGTSVKPPIDVFVITGEFPDGQLGEVFVKIGKQGSKLHGMMDNLCASVSVGLQYGIPLSIYVDKFRHTKFEPAGMVEGHPMIKTCSSPLDLVFKWLEEVYDPETGYRATNAKKRDKLQEELGMLHIKTQTVQDQILAIV